MAGGPNDQQWVNDPHYAPGLDEQNAFQYLSQKSGASSPIIVASKGTVDSGVVPTHAYSVEGLSTVNGERMITLRNPWGNGEVGNDGRDDGLFTMRFSDFLRNFGGVYTTP